MTTLLDFYVIDREILSRQCLLLLKGRPGNHTVCLSVSMVATLMLCVKTKEGLTRVDSCSLHYMLFAQNLPRNSCEINFGSSIWGAVPPDPLLFIFCTVPLTKSSSYAQYMLKQTSLYVQKLEAELCQQLVGTSMHITQCESRIVCRYHTEMTI